MKIFHFFRSRKLDPITSHLSAEQAQPLAQNHAEMIYKCLLEHGATGKDGIAKLTGLNPNQVARRLPEMEKMGIVQQTGQLVMSEAKRKEREWSLIKGVN